MTKGEGNSGSTTNSANVPASSSSKAVTGVKRPMPGQEENNSKKPCIAPQSSANNTNDIPPDSPGSPGEMAVYFSWVW